MPKSLCRMRNFFRVLADPKANERWFLKSPLDINGQQIDPRLFTSGTKYDGVQSLNLPLRREGIPVDFNFGDFDMVVTPKELNEAIEKLLGDLIQRISIKVANSQVPFEILNALDAVSCISEQKSEFLKWTSEYGVPDKVGKFRMITKLFIDPDKANGHKLFRIREWKAALIIDEEIKDLLERRNITGITFQSVS